MFQRPTTPHKSQKHKVMAAQLTTQIKKSNQDRDMQNEQS